MRARIRKKDKDRKGNQRYILEWEEDGKICTKVLIPKKLMDFFKKSRTLKEETP